MWRYKLMCFFILAITVKGAVYRISTDATARNGVRCSLYAPNLKYSLENGWEVDEPTFSTTLHADVWIGYINASVALDFLGCNDSTMLDDTIVVTSIGDCYSHCRENAFGVQKIKIDNTTRVRCKCTSGNQNVSATTCTQKIEYQPFIYGEENDSYAMYNSSNAVLNSDDNSFCYVFTYSSWQWRPCKINPWINTLCSYVFPNKSRIARVTQQFKETWHEANTLCLQENYLPATFESIRKETLSPENSQDFWTGVIRAFAIIKAETTELFKESNDKQFAFLKHGSSGLQFTSEGSKHALCVSNVMDSSTAKVSISQSANAPTSELSTSVESDSMMTETKDSKYEFPAVGVSIGVSVGIVFIGVAIVAIVILRKRGVLRCKMNTNTDKPNVGEEREIDDEKKLDNPVDNHSCFILEKVPQSYETNADHFNAADETDEKNYGTDNYNSIDDTEEPYERVTDDNGDYDYTTNALSSVNNNHESNNIYNKLKIDGHGDYDHVGIRGHNDDNVSGVDYDTTSARLDNGKNAGSDYNHIQHTAHKAGATYTDIKGGDYDATYGMKIKVVKSDGSDYAHVNKY